jgi:hypothetical protein
MIKRMKFERPLRTIRTGSARVHVDTLLPKHSGALLFLGALSALLYGTLFWEQDLVNSYFPRGGLYALLPISTALIFSIVHGSFTSRFWSALGVEASRKDSEEE